MPNAFFIQGLLYSDLREPQEIRTVKVDIDEIHAILKKTIGIGVRIEHKGPSIGKVVDAFLTPDKTAAIVHLFVDASSPEGARARDGVMNKKYRGLSFGSIARKLKNGLRISEYKPIEVSIVEVGGVDRAFITLWGDRMTDLHCSLQRFNDVFTKTMSETKAEEVKAALPPVEPTEDQDKEARAVFKIMKEIGINADNARDFVKLAANAMNTNVTQYGLVIKGSEDRMGLAEYAQKTLKPDQIDEFEQDLRRELQTRVAGPSAHFMITASLMGDYQEEKRKGEIARAEIETLKKMLPKQVAAEERKTVATNIPTLLLNNSQIIEEAFSRKRPRAEDVGEVIKRSRDEVLSMIKAKPPTVEIIGGDIG